jgi:hypothetical protein
MALKSRTPLNLNALRRDYSALPQIAAIKAQANQQMIGAIQSGLQKRKERIEKKEKNALNEKILKDLIDSDPNNTIVPAGMDEKELAKIITLPESLAYRRALVASDKASAQIEQMTKADIFALSQLTGGKELTAEEQKRISDAIKANPGMIFGAYVKRLEAEPKALPKDPVSIQEFEYLKSQGTDISYEDYLKLKRSGTTVNIGGEGQFGPIAPGMQLVKLADGTFRMDPIPGSPEDIKRKKELAAETEAAKQKEESALDKSVLVLDEIQRSIELASDPDSFTTGFFGQMFQKLGGTRANDLRGLLDTIKANIGFDQLNAMRAASPTGGALGNVTEREIEFLQAVRGSVDQSMSKEQLVENLKRLQYEYTKVVHGKKIADSKFKKSESDEESGTPKQKSDNEALKNIIDKYTDTE